MIHLLVGIALIGFIAWLIIALIPMDARIANIVVIVAIAIAVFYVLSAFGLLTGIDRPVPQLR